MHGIAWNWGAKLGIVLALLAFAGCDSPGAAPAASQTNHIYQGTGPLQILCTTSQVADLLSHIAGEHAEVTGLMGPGVDPHLYKAAPSDRQKFNQADILFYNGMHLEARLTDMLVQMARYKPAVAVTAGLQEADDERLLEPPEFEGHYDPHIWHDAALWADCARYAAEQLAAFDPTRAEDYRRNAGRYIEQLLAIHQQAREQLAQIPAPQRVLVTAHDAFGYFGQAYGIEVHGLQGISTVDEPNVTAMEMLVDLLVENKIKAVFIESSVPRRNVESLIEAARARGHQVRIGGELYSDAMGEPGTPEGTYLGMFEHNVNTIVEALQ